MGSQREAVARDVERGEATFGREKVESSESVRVLVGVRWPRNCYGGRRIIVKGIRNKEGEREREERKGRKEGRRMGTRGVCRGTERRNVDERRKIGPVMEMRGPGGQWVSGPGPLNS